MDASTAVTAMLDGVVEVIDALVVDGDHWLRIGTGERGTIDPQAVARIQAKSVLAGSAPKQTRQEIAEDLVGPQDAAQALRDDGKAQHAARAERIAADSHDVAEVPRRPGSARPIAAFTYDQVRLTDADVDARLQLGVNATLDLRDAAWMTITRDNAHAWIAL